jgi:hypothetical protein
LEVAVGVAQPEEVSMVAVEVAPAAIELQPD